MKVVAKYAHIQLIELTGLHYEDHRKKFHFDGRLYLFEPEQTDELLNQKRRRHEEWRQRHKGNRADLKGNVSQESGGVPVVTALHSRLRRYIFACTTKFTQPPPPTQTNISSYPIHPSPIHCVIPD